MDNPPIIPGSGWSFVEKSGTNMGHLLPLDTSFDKWWYNQTLNFVNDQAGLRPTNTKGFLRRQYPGRNSEVTPFTWEIFCNNEVAELITNAGITNPVNGQPHEFDSGPVPIQVSYQSLFGDFIPSENDCDTPEQRIFTWTEEPDPGILPHLQYQHDLINAGSPQTYEIFSDFTDSDNRLDNWYNVPGVIIGTCTITCDNSDG